MLVAAESLQLPMCSPCREFQKYQWSSSRQYSCPLQLALAEGEGGDLLPTVYLEYSRYMRHRQPCRDLRSETRDTWT